MAGRTLEMLIGRLITDERFRHEFLDEPERTLIDLRDRGWELTEVDIDALLRTDRAVWARTADAIHPRLQKASLTSRIHGDGSHHQPAVTAGGSAERRTRR